MSVLHAHHYHYPGFFKTHSEDALLGVYIVALAIVIIAILVSAVSLIEQTRSFVPQ